MLTNKQLSQLIYGDIEKRIVIEEAYKGRKRQLTSEDQKRR